MAKKSTNTKDQDQSTLETKTKAHFEAVKNFIKKTNKDVHLPRKIRKEIARLKTLENKGKDE